MNPPKINVIIDNFASHYLATYPANTKMQSLSGLSKICHRNNKCASHFVFWSCIFGQSQFRLMRYIMRRFWYMIYWYTVSCYLKYCSFWLLCIVLRWSFFTLKCMGMSKQLKTYRIILFVRHQCMFDHRVPSDPTVNVHGSSLFHVRITSKRQANLKELQNHRSSKTYIAIDSWESGW